MKYLILFSNTFNDGFGGMEAHREAFINYFSKNANYKLILAAKNNEQFYIKCNDELTIFNCIKDVINNFKRNIKSDAIFFFNDFWWINEIEELKKAFYVNKFILRSGGNDVFRAPILNDDVSLNIRQTKIVTTINSYVDTLIINSDYSYHQNVELGINPSKMKKIRGGVDTDLITDLLKSKNTNRNIFDKKFNTKNKIIISMITRFVPFKGVLEFLKQTKDYFFKNDSVLLLIGDGPLYDDIKDYLELYFENKYIILGSLKHEESLKYISISDVIINSSLNYKRFFGEEYYFHTETMGRTILEAVSFKIPVIATNVGGVFETFAENKPAYIGKLVDNFEHFEDLIINIQESTADISVISSYSWNSVFEMYCHLFSENNPKVYALDIDKTILDKNGDPVLTAKYLREHKGNNILILNTSRKSYALCEKIYKDSNADYLIYKNGAKIYRGSKPVEIWHNFDTTSCEVIYYELLNQLNDQIEITHSHCISVVNNELNKKIVLNNLKKHKDYKVIESDNFLKIVHKYYNKGDALNYVLKDLIYSLLIVGGDATNDLGFLDKGDKIFASNLISDKISSKNLFIFKDSDNKMELLKRIFSPDTVISVTSYPERIDSLKKVIESLEKQTFLPDEVAIYLSEKEFDSKPAFIKSDILNINIRLVPNNLKSHKKYFYALKDYACSDIITIDDDVYYLPQMVETLIRYHKVFTNDVICNSSRFITIENGKPANYYDWIKNYPKDTPSDLLMALGTLGVYYPKNTFDNEIFNLENILKYSLTTDDLWLKINEIKNNIKTVLTDFDKTLTFTDGSQNEPLCKINYFSNSNNLNFNSLLNLYKINLRNLFIKEFNLDNYTTIYTGYHSKCYTNGVYLVKVLINDNDFNEYTATKFISNVDKMKTRKCLGCDDKLHNMVYSFLNFFNKFNSRSLGYDIFVKIKDIIHEIQSIKVDNFKSWEKYRDNCIEALSYINPNILSKDEIDILKEAKEEVIIHGDLNPNNIFCLDDDLVLIDFENCYIGPSWWDACYLLANYSFQEVDPKILLTLSNKQIKFIILIIKIRLGRLIRKKYDTSEVIERLESWNTKKV